MNCQCVNTSAGQRQVTPNLPVTAEGTETYDLYARSNRGIVQWVGCEGKEDKLDCKSDYSIAYIHLDSYYLVSYFGTTEVS